MANVSNVTLKNKTGLGMAKNLKMGTCKICSTSVPTSCYSPATEFGEKTIRFYLAGQI